MGANLIIRPEKLGDLVVATPVFRAFKESFPSQPLHLLTDDVFGDILRHDPHIDKIITTRWRGTKYPDRPSFKQLHEILRKNGPYERAAILYSNFEIWNWLLAFNGLKQVSQIGGTLAAKILGHHCILRNGYTSGKHMSQLFLEVASKVGAATSGPLPKLYITEEECVAVAIRFPFLHNPKKIFVHAFSLTAMANLSPAAYMRLCIAIANRTEYKFYIIGTAKELGAVDVPLHPRISTELVGNLTLRELMAAITFADLVMGGSSGIVHLSAALGVPTLGLYCPHAHHHEAWGPLGY